MKIPSAPAVIPNATILAFTIRSFLSNQVIVRLAITLLHELCFAEYVSGREV
jgi:hypothetical protein